MAAHPIGYVEYRSALSPQGRYGRWIRTRPAVLQLNGIVFLHGGLNPERTPRRLEDVNKQVLAEIKRWDDYQTRMVIGKCASFFTRAEILRPRRTQLEWRLGEPCGSGLRTSRFPVNETLGLND